MAGPTPPNPAELLARESLDGIVNKLREIYDYIIIDTAPVGLVTDTLQLARIIDATVYLCRADYTTKDSFVLINSLAMEKKLPNMSIVINGLDMTKKKYGYYYGYGKYAKYGKYARYGYYSKGAYGAGGYRSYSSYSSYGSYNSQSNTYISKDDNSIKQ
jgi:putative capsular polysaccharide transport protein